MTVITALIGICIPFFGGLLGFFGGLAFSSTSYFVSYKFFSLTVFINYFPKLISQLIIYAAPLHCVACPSST